jgi:hypothetical protein
MVWAGREDLGRDFVLQGTSGGRGGWHHVPTGIEFWAVPEGQGRDTTYTYYFGRQEPGHWLVRCTDPKGKYIYEEKLKADGLDNSFKTPIPVRDEYRLRFGSEHIQLGPMEDVSDMPTPWTYELATLYSQFRLLNGGGAVLAQR